MTELLANAVVAVIVWTAAGAAGYFTQRHRFHGRPFL